LGLRTEKNPAKVVDPRVAKLEAGRGNAGHD